MLSTPPAHLTSLKISGDHVLFPQTNIPRDAQAVTLLLLILGRWHFPCLLLAPLHRGRGQYTLHSQCEVDLLLPAHSSASQWGPQISPSNKLRQRQASCHSLHSPYSRKIALSLLGTFAVEDGSLPGTSFESHWWCPTSCCVPCCAIVSFYC